MSPPSRAVLVPPRPNLGPEPLPPSRLSTGPLVLGGLALAFLIAIALVARRRRRPRRSRTTATQAPPRARNGDPSSPRDRMIDWSDAVREALVARFGPAWRAKTTEEIAVEDALVPALGDEQAALLVRFLAAADRLKFAQEGEPAREPAAHSVEDWEPWVAAFVIPEAGASSKTKGK